MAFYEWTIVLLLLLLFLQYWYIIWLLRTFCKAIRRKYMDNNIAHSRRKTWRPPLQTKLSRSLNNLWFMEGQKWTNHEVLRGWLSRFQRSLYQMVPHCSLKIPHTWIQTTQSAKFIKSVWKNQLLSLCKLVYYAFCYFPQPYIGIDVGCSNFHLTAKLDLHKEGLVKNHNPSLCALKCDFGISINIALWLQGDTTFLTSRESHCCTKGLEWNMCTLFAFFATKS